MELLEAINRPIKKIVDEALADCESIKMHCFTKDFSKIKWNERVDVWWHDFIEGLQIIANQK